jgi:hypothetical protein
MQRSIEVLALVLFGVLGLSHILQPKAWVETFVLIRGKGAPGSFVDGLPYLVLATIVIAFHNVWSGIPMLLTLIGWASLIKSVLRFCVPAWGLKMMARVSMERAWEFQAAGVVLVALASVLGYGVYAG